ncbi:MAG: N-acetylmuramoyl-L-alanine amidase [Alphaproteobacteria bacterium]|nr:MAG: N-acetylmuramoyl-L-alanine amidase [Alphaproteobacteria bacterium]
MATGAEALERLCDKASQVSAHYLIEEDGRVYSLVPEDKRAWHAGVAAWEGDRDINSLSIGIELVNPGHDSPGYVGDYRPFPEAQMTALTGLCGQIISRHQIAPWHVLGHSDVAPDRKCDPGELFNWQGLAAEGIGLLPINVEGQGVGSPVEVGVTQQKLSDYGYQIAVTNRLDSQTSAVIRAFQQHFRPANVSGTFDQECGALLEGLLSAKAH